jgi:glycosyltransferase involved in cell wall biosynthesis
MGGTYYVLNLIQSLNSLNEPDKPELVIISKSYNSFESVKNLNYPYITYVRYSQFQKLINRITRLILHQNIIHSKLFNSLTALFPIYDNLFIGSSPNALYWIPDFQDKYLPKFFSKNELKSRKENYSFISTNKTHVIFSSKDAYSDYSKFYPNAMSTEHVLNFAVFHPKIDQISIDTLRVKYKLPQKYFIVSNQFWAHKNHLIILRAIKILKERTIPIHIAFTGKQYDGRNPKYFSTLEKYIKLNGIMDSITFLGFIPREDQLVLMQNAVSIIQPSFFEGWSTVIEDSKALGSHLIASSLNVNKEQIEKNVNFFSPDNHDELAIIMMGIKTTPNKTHKSDYKVFQNKFGEEFIEIVKLLSQKKIK